MNQKQVKLLRYFTKHTGDIQLAARVKDGWPHMTARAKGKVTTWMKKVIVTMMALKNERDKHEAKKKVLMEASNLEVLKGFAL